MLEIRLFGALRLAWQGRALPLAGLPKTGPLLAYLLLNRMQAVDREHLAFTLWPDVSEATAKANLRRHVYDLQNALPPALADLPWIVRTHRSLQWNPQANYWLDVARFESLDDTPEHLASAVSLYTGDLLAYLDDEWLAYERGRLRAHFLSRLQALIQHHTGAADYAEALACVERILQDDPLHEEAVRESMKLRTYLGDRAGALQAYRHFREQLQAELELPPLPETEQLAAQISADGLASPAKPGPTLAPPPTGLARSANPAPSNVPAPLRPLVGRDEEVALLLQLLTSGGSTPRLVTLTGMAGVGKTRLAQEVAYRLLQQDGNHFPDGVFLIPLAGLSAAEQFLPALAAAVGLSLDEGGSPLHSLIEQLRYRQLLLVLDNFEHLLDAAPLVGDLLPAIPGLRLLVTSQSLLNLYGEQGFSVKPLVVPSTTDLMDAAQLGRLPAVALFCQAARIADVHFRLSSENAQAIADICHRLDGLPLALELAAARTKILPAQAILSQLTDRLTFLARHSADVPARHRSLRAAIEWSYNLLDEDEQQLFSRLALFADGFTPQAVTAILFGRPNPSPSQVDWEVMGQITRLLDKNMIYRVVAGDGAEESRFAMLTTLQAFALEKLAQETGVDVLRGRYVEFYAAELESRYQHRESGREAQWSAWFQVEEININAGLDWALAPGSDRQIFVAGLRALLNADSFWTGLLRIIEARQRIEQCLARQHEAPLADQSSLLEMAGHFYGLSGAPGETVFAAYEKALEIARRVEDPHLLVKVLDGYGKTANELQEYGLSSRLWAEAIAIAREHMPEMAAQLANLLNNLSNAHKCTGDFAEAVACLEECLALLRAHGLTERLIAAHTNLAAIARLKGDLELDAAHLRHGLGYIPGIANLGQKIVFLSNAAERALVTEDFPISAILHSAMQSICQQVNMAWPPYYQREFASYVTTTRQHLDPEQFNRLWNLGAHLSLNQAIQRVADWLGMEEGE